jgi:hypothetical protein
MGGRRFDSYQGEDARKSCSSKLRFTRSDGFALPSPSLSVALKIRIRGRSPRRIPGSAKRTTAVCLVLQTH